LIVRAVRRKLTFVKSRFEARNDYKRFESALYFWSIVAFVAFLFYPPVAGGITLAFLVYFYLAIYSEYFDERKRDYYEAELLPLMFETHYIQLGYEVPDDEEELNRHLAICKKENAGEELAKLEKKVRMNEPYRIVGLPKDALTRHVWVLGATGTGKSSLLMRLFKELLKLGAGLIYVDGKSDAKLARKLYSLAYEEGRETSFFLVNFLKPEETKFDSNTFQPLATLSPSLQIEFLASLASTGSGGNMDYWEGRGKALLAPIIWALAFRKKYYGEAYSYETISTALSSSEFSFYASMLTALAMAWNSRLKRDKRLERIMREAKRMITPRTVAPELESLVSYLVQMPHKTEAVERLGYDRSYLEDLYRAYNNAMEIYLSTLSAVWPKTVKAVAKAMLEVASRKGYQLEKMPIADWRKLHAEALEELDQETKKAYFDPPEKDVTQHNYAQQQWTKVFGVFERFSHIFGSLDPEVDMLDVLRNNKILYVLLPALEQDRQGAETLGRIFVTAIKAASSKALGGRLEGLTNTQLNIVESLITPIPLGLVVLDEYGAYPVPDIDTIAAQVRSINMSFWIATQDLTSGRVGGRDENSLLRLYANTRTKIIMGLEDKEAKRELENEIARRAFAQESQALRVDDRVDEAEKSVSLQQGVVIEPARIKEFDKGMSLMVSHGRYALVQVFWADQPEIDRLLLSRFEPV